MEEASFHRFNQLPIELRHQIWKYALPPQTQIHELSVYSANLYAVPELTEDELNGLDEYEQRFFGGLWNIVYVPTRATPAVLQTCQEARQLGRRDYYIAHEKGQEMIGRRSITRYIEQEKEDYQVYLRDQESLSEDDEPATLFHIEMDHPRTTESKSHILCGNNELVHFLPCDERLHRDSRSISTRVVSEQGHRQIFDGIRYLAISIQDLDTWGWQVPRTDLYFSAVDVLFVLRKETDCPDHFNINWNKYPEVDDKYSKKATDNRPIATKRTMLVESLEEAVAEIERIVSRQEHT